MSFMVFNSKTQQIYRFPMSKHQRVKTGITESRFGIFVFTSPFLSNKLQQSRGSLWPAGKQRAHHSKILWVYPKSWTPSFFFFFNVEDDLFIYMNTIFHQINLIILIHTNYVGFLLLLFFFFLINHSKFGGWMRLKLVKIWVQHETNHFCIFLNDSVHYLGFGT